MVVPAEAPVEPPHEDLPVDCIGEYTEAREIFAKSPRAAAALLRLCIQKLMPHLGESGANLNDDIKSLVSKGLPIVVQKAFDVCRVVGNNAVHPGEIDLNDTPETAQQLFRMINFIVVAWHGPFMVLPGSNRSQLPHGDGNPDDNNINSYPFEFIGRHYLRKTRSTNPL